MMKTMLLLWMVALICIAQEVPKPIERTPEVVFSMFKKAVKEKDSKAIASLMANDLSAFGEITEITRSLFETITLLEIKTDGDLALGIVTAANTLKDKAVDDFWFVRRNGQWLVIWSPLNIREYETQKEAVEKLTKWYLARKKALKNSIAE